METRVTKVRINFEGIYEWGKGWTSDYAYRMWNLYWSKLNAIYWNCFMKTENGQISYYLVSTHGGAYIHPDTFFLVIMGVDGSLKELEEICRRCAKECGGSMKMYASTKEVEFEENTLWAK